MLLYYVEFLELGSGTCEASASSMLREGDWDHIRDMIYIDSPHCTSVHSKYLFYEISCIILYKHKVSS